MASIKSRQINREEAGGRGQSRESSAKQKTEAEERWEGLSLLNKAQRISQGSRIYISASYGCVQIWTKWRRMYWKPQTRVQGCVSTFIRGNQQMFSNRVCSARNRHFTPKHLFLVIIWLFLSPNSTEPNTMLSHDKTENLSSRNLKLNKVISQH